LRASVQHLIDCLAIADAPADVHLGVSSREYRFNLVTVLSPTSDGVQIDYVKVLKALLTPG
jgi:hypothetical protein